MGVRREKRRNRRTGKKRKIVIADVTMTYPDGTSERVRPTVPFNNMRLAAEWERLKRIELLEEWKRKKHGVNDARKEMTFSEFAEEFMTVYVAVNNKRSEQVTKRRILDNHLLPFFGPTRLCEIRARTWDALATPQEPYTVLRAVAASYEVSFAAPQFFLLSLTTILAALTSLQSAGEAEVVMEENQILWRRK